MQSHKFSNENIQANLACPKYEEIFKKEFPSELEGQITEFKCPVCNSASEADLPSKGIEEQRNLKAISRRRERKILKNSMKVID
ncbi:MAG TPA: hypothetical protein VFR61_06635 [Nitrososphaeraceae archaeon]|nr:hypothetical protein [Nitrososphaeraceae archaeon]